MTIDKWLSKKTLKEEEIKREKIFKSLSKDEVQNLKKKKIRELAQKKKLQPIEAGESNDILQNIIEFKNWLNQRTYLKGDLDKIETWIKNLNSKFNLELSKERTYSEKNEKLNLRNAYNEIPPDFLDEKMKIAINKKINGTKRTNSDNYYLRKLKNLIQDKLIEVKYYQILDKIIKL